MGGSGGAGTQIELVEDVGDVPHHGARSKVERRAAVGVALVRPRAGAARGESPPVSASVAPGLAVAKLRAAATESASATASSSGRWTGGPRAIVGRAVAAAAGGERSGWSAGRPWSDSLEGIVERGTTMRSERGRVNGADARVWAEGAWRGILYVYPHGMGRGVREGSPEMVKLVANG